MQNIMEFVNIISNLFNDIRLFPKDLYGIIIKYLITVPHEEKFIRKISTWSECYVPACIKNNILYTINEGKLNMYNIHEETVKSFTAFDNKIYVMGDKIYKHINRSKYDAIIRYKDQFTDGMLIYTCIDSNIRIKLYQNKLYICTSNDIVIINHEEKITSFPRKEKHYAYTINVIDEYIYLRIRTNKNQFKYVKYNMNDTNYILIDDMYMKNAVIIDEEVYMLTYSGKIFVCDLNLNYIRTFNYNSSANFITYDSGYLYVLCDIFTCVYAITKCKI